jgi:hypothetical protein
VQFAEERGPDAGGQDSYVYEITAATFFRRKDNLMEAPPNQPMKPTAPLGNKFGVFAATLCVGLSLSR